LEELRIVEPLVVVAERPRREAREEVQVLDVLARVEEPRAVAALEVEHDGETVGELVPLEGLVDVLGVDHGRSRAPELRFELPLSAFRANGLCPPRHRATTPPGAELLSCGFSAPK